MIGKRPGTKCRYIVGFMRGKPPTDFYSSQEYLWIQLTPMPLGSITPEQMVAVYPKPASQLQKQYETMLKYKVEPGLARYDERLGAIVYDAAFPEADGKIRAVMRSFTVLTGTQAIGIVAYSRPEHAEMTFEEARGVASTLTLKEREQVPTAWKERLKQLLKASP